MHGVHAQFADDEDDAGHEPPPIAIGQAERRLQVRAYNFWTSLLQDGPFPAISSLRPGALPEFAPYAILLDFGAGTPDDPVVTSIGQAVHEECGDSPVRTLSDAPAHSLLSRIAEHYRLVLINQAPTGFEAEFVNARGATILYRGILLPFSGASDTIEHAYAVINWKELADTQVLADLHSEMESSLESLSRLRIGVGPLGEWADGPADMAGPADLRSRTSRRSPGDLAIEAGLPLESAALHDRLRTLAPLPLALDDEGEEFALLLARRMPGGPAVLLGEVPHDPHLIDRAAQRLLG